MLSIILSFVSALLGSSVIGVIVKHVLDKKDELNEHDKAQDEGIRLILLKQFQDQGKEFVKLGQLTKLEWDVFDAMYKCYKKLGGDGYADMLYEEVKKLPKEELL